jgi:hypothetical protein
MSAFYVKYLLSIGAIVGGYLFLFISNNMIENRIPLGCVFKSITGIPCPGCGMGRATNELFKGNFALSLQYHILAIPFSIFVLMILCWLGFDLYRKKETIFPFFDKKIRKKYIIFLFMLILSSWIINIYRGI